MSPIKAKTQEARQLPGLFLYLQEQAKSDRSATALARLSVGEQRRMRVMRVNV